MLEMFYFTFAESQTLPVFCLGIMDYFSRVAGQEGDLAQADQGGEEPVQEDPWHRPPDREAQGQEGRQVDAHLFTLDSTDDRLCCCCSPPVLHQKFGRKRSRAFSFAPGLFWLVLSDMGG